MTMHLHILAGCAPAPLASYLKAMGILRLVGQQADPQARGWWDGERFCLLSRLSRADLEAFFLDQYQPTPLVAPWNGGSGFYPKDNQQALRALEASRAPRFAPFQTAIAEARLAIRGLKAKPDKAQKPPVFHRAMQLWRGPHRDWLDAVVVLGEDDQLVFPSLLGTGGNDGRLDFTNNYMQQLDTLFDLTSPHGAPRPEARSWLQDALWSLPAHGLAERPVGQFYPGAAGGANSSTGFESGNRINPWDYVLMLEGTLLFASRTTRRLDPAATGQASAPFAMQAQATGFATPGDEDAQRGEQWMPLWTYPVTLGELKALIGEARVQLGRRLVGRPLDMARAISRLGVARGIDSFVRYGYLVRNGLSNFAVPLGRVPVRHRPRAYLIDDLAGWMDQLQRLSRDKHASGRLIHAERRLADAVFAALTHDHTPQRWQAILLAAADIEALQASGTAVQAGPIPPLRPQWVEAVAEDSPEFRLALALGSAAAAYMPNGQPSDPVRHHFLPLQAKNPRKFATIDNDKLSNDPRVVATGRDPQRDLAAIVERRLIEAAQQGQRRCRLVAAAGCGAQLADLAQFLDGHVDIERLLGLARAFMALRWSQWTADLCPPSPASDDEPVEGWLAVRLCCLPWPLDELYDVPADERIVRGLVAGHAMRAIQIACQRLRSVGIRPPMYAGTVDGQAARRWAAALVFPIHRSTARQCVEILDPSLTKGPQYA
jgi:CRISPR-associated protein Csx17